MCLAYCQIITVPAIMNIRFTYLLIVIFVLSACCGCDWRYLCLSCAIMDSEQYVSNLLGTWKLGEYATVFRENQIDFLALENLEENELAQLIPLAGPRTKFKINWRAWKTDLQKANENRKRSSSEYCDLSSSILSETFAILDEGDNLNEFVANEPTESIAESDTSSIQELKAVDVLPDEDNNYVHHILKSSLDGRAILLEGNRKNGMLNASYRRKLAQLIIRHELEQDPSKSITRGEFTRWSQEISNLFKHESPLVYYTAYIGATNFQTKRNAAGKLYEAYINRRRNLRKTGQLPSYERALNNSSPSVEKVEELDTVLSEKLQWLKHSVDPWFIVEKNWTDTTTKRLSAIQHAGLVSEYFRTYPALKTPQGYTLLFADFNYLYPGTENNLFSKLVLQRDHILEIVQKRASSKELKVLLEPYLSLIISADESSEVRSNAALLSLPFLLPQGLVNKSNKKTNWRPSRTEIRDGFVTQIVTEGHLEITIQKRKEKLQKLGVSFQPLVVFAGESIASITSAFVVVDDTFYKFDSLTRAVDTAFKVFQATHANYPQESELVWLLIQRLFYGIYTKYDRLTSSLRCLLLDLGASDQ